MYQGAGTRGSQLLRWEVQGVLSSKAQPARARAWLERAACGQSHKAAQPACWCQSRFALRRRAATGFESRQRGGREGGPHRGGGGGRGAWGAGHPDPAALPRAAALLAEGWQRAGWDAREAAPHISITRTRVWARAHSVSNRQRAPRGRTQFRSHHASTMLARSMLKGGLARAAWRHGHSLVPAPQLGCCLSIHPNVGIVPGMPGAAERSRGMRGAHHSCGASPCARAAARRARANGQREPRSDLSERPAPPRRTAGPARARHTMPANLPASAASDASTGGGGGGGGGGAAALSLASPAVVNPVPLPKKASA
jgi:hypothetical protein